MQREQRSVQQNQHVLNERYVNQYDTVNKNGSQQEFEEISLSRFHVLVLYGGSIIYFLLFLNNAYQLLTTSAADTIWAFIAVLFENAWLVSTSLVLFLFHTLILGLTSSAIKAKNKRDVMNAVIKEEIAWGLLGFALGFISTNTFFLLQLFIGSVMAFVFYKTYKVLKFSPITIFRIIVLMFLVNAIATILDPDYVGIAKFINIYSYVSYEFNGGTIFKFVVIALIFGGLLKAIREHGIWHVIISTFKFFGYAIMGTFKFVFGLLISIIAITMHFFGKKKAKQMSNTKEQYEMYTPDWTELKEQTNQTVETKSKEEKSKQNQPVVEDEVETESVTINKEIENKVVEEDEEESPTPGYYFQDKRQPSTIKEVITSNTSFSKRVKEVIRKIAKL